MLHVYDHWLQELLRFSKPMSIIIIIIIKH